MSEVAQIRTGSVAEVHADWIRRIGGGPCALSAGATGALKTAHMPQVKTTENIFQLTPKPKLILKPPSILGTNLSFSFGFGFTSSSGVTKVGVTRDGN